MGTPPSGELNTLPTGFSLTRALFTKNVWVSHLGRQTVFFLEKTGDLFWPSLSLLFISLVHSGVAHYFRHVAMLQKFTAPLVGPFFVGAPVRPNMLNMPKSAAEHLSKHILPVRHCRSCCWPMWPMRWRCLSSRHIGNAVDPQSGRDWR